MIYTCFHTVKIQASGCGSQTCGVTFMCFQSIKNTSSPAGAWQSLTRAVIRSAATSPAALEFYICLAPALGGPESRCLVSLPLCLFSSKCKAYDNTNSSTKRDWAPRFARHAILFLCFVVFLCPCGLICTSGPN